jgi:deoxyribodipyrimidine photolyase-related protein
MRRGFAADRLTLLGRVETLAVVLGDQLDSNAPAIKQLNKSRDEILMMEVTDESTAVPSHKQRTVFFLSAMRHFAVEALKAGYRVHYVTLTDRANTQSFAGEIRRAVRKFKPQRLVCTEPGDWRVRKMLMKTAAWLALPIDVLADEHFLLTHEAFDDWMRRRKQPVMEYFYREQRRKLGLLLEPNGKPVGSAWNFDKENRCAFKAAPDIGTPYTPRPDVITREVIDAVNRKLAELPGSIGSFRWPVTHGQAQRALADFVAERLCHFGPYQDAMWTAEPFLYHSLLSAALNVKLLDPRDCVAVAVKAYENRQAPLNSVEAFIRQIIGWREFIRGIYWYEGPDYAKRNALEHTGVLPAFYWTGDTDMTCMREALRQVLDHGYGHHIQRLMVTGNFALIAGIAPRAVCDWYIGMYVDAVDWVTLPNTLGMALHADGGVVGTKPYAASGRYIQRMSNYCQNCRFDPAKRSGPDACPFTTFHWDFLLRHKKRFMTNRRMSLVLQNLTKMSTAQRKQIQVRAQELRVALGIGPT